MSSAPPPPPTGQGGGGGGGGGSSRREKTAGITKVRGFPIFPGFAGVLEAPPPAEAGAAPPPAAADAPKYIYEDFLSRGSSGDTYRVVERATGERHALKVMQIPASAAARLKMDTEILVLRHMRHFACMRLVDEHRTRTHLLLVLEYCDAGDLAFQLKALRDGDGGGGVLFPERELCFILLQITLGLHYMHVCQSMLHRDLKPHNVLVTTAGLVKIGDFGLSNRYATTAGDVGRTICGTPPYVAPELWLRRRYGRPADMWSLGVLLYECMAGFNPFYADVPEVMRENILHATPAPLPAAYSPALRELAARLLSKDPAERPDAAALLATPLLTAARGAFLDVLRASGAGEALVARVAEDIRRQLAAPPAAAADASVRAEGEVERLRVEPDGTLSFQRRRLVLAGGALTIGPPRGDASPGSRPPSRADSAFGSSLNPPPPPPLTEALLPPPAGPAGGGGSGSASLASGPRSPNTAAAAGAGVGEAAPGTPLAFPAAHQPHSTIPVTDVMSAELAGGGDTLALRLAGRNSYVYFRTPDAAAWLVAIRRALGW